MLGFVYDMVENKAIQSNGCHYANVYSFVEDKTVQNNGCHYAHVYFFLLKEAVIYFSERKSVSYFFAENGFKIKV